MTGRNGFQKFVEQYQFSAETIAANTRQIHKTVLDESSYLDAPNFTTFHEDDLRHLFEQYDGLFFEGRCRNLLGHRALHFRLSERMTRAGGKTTWFVPRESPENVIYEIAVSSTLLFQTFDDVHRTVIVTGVECRDRLEALQRIFEHEMIHLAELLVWRDSSCKAARFQSMAERFFGHTDHRHQLVTPREQASKIHGVRLGSRVRFRFDDAEYVGVVNRITVRATVLVKDKKGPRYSDGKRYTKFYIPIEMLKPLE